jgi:pimeloyl-ACP methyl ester carboxylesterase
METVYTTSPDGTRIAYDVTGTGPALMLLHGGMQTRRVWHDLGSVDRLRPRFSVVTVDLRGNGGNGTAQHRVARRNARLAVSRTGRSAVPNAVARWIGERDCDEEELTRIDNVLPRLEKFTTNAKTL